MTTNTPIWDNHPWTGLASLENDLTADVCVIGLGGSGLACIHELLSLGQRVVGLEAGLVAGGAAGRNGGFLLAGSWHSYHEAVQTLGRDHARDLYALTLRQLKKMQGETPEAIRQVGSLRIALDQEEYEDCQHQLSAMRADGFQVEAYEGVEGRGLLLPEDCAFNPLLRCRILAKQALQQGALLFEQSPAIRISGQHVQTPKGDVFCKQVIVAVDGKLEQLLPELVGQARTARLQMLATAPTNEVKLPRPVYARWGYEYWQQLPTGEVALGGFRDKFREAEWIFESEPTQDIQGMLEHFLRNHIGVQAEITHRWAASVAYTENGMPIFKEVRPQVWAVGAYSGTGNVIGALCGRGAAQMAALGKSDIATFFQ
jgi:glycine/D-amino acid oxidase-like deaminating enzyme